MTDNLLLEICSGVPTSQSNTGTDPIRDAVTLNNTGTPVVGDVVPQATNV